MSKVEDAISLLEELLNDRGIPRNVKNSVEDSVNILKNSEESEDVKLSTVTTSLDEASNDPNVSLYARTKIWDVVSKLEELNK